MNKFLLLSVIAAVLYLSGCSENNSVEPVLNKDNTVLMKQDLPKEVRDELQAVKAATAKYNSYLQALADGYVDINAVIPHMGHHLLNPALLDTVFEVTKPEILVYELRDNGHYQLVAVEYGAPLNLMAQPPEGFTGSYDVWSPNNTYGIWTLHAWIWEYNPDGVFASFNPNVP